ncbi:hypothetical protein amb3771 [Paramagnetospirillum magneticum AMB-1]|uniref:Polypeptide-transport-associated ShlB-type domain-containing protein n=2 Tax=Paramagnetospirillum magneticum TaxID=84159 RepID=Q2W0Q0_PARM1|nr:hypothetical protein amb3771 [Paramagnetospirillum magneticum AMB-1]
MMFNKIKGRVPVMTWEICPRSLSIYAITFAMATQSAAAQGNLPASDHPGRIEKRFEQPRKLLSIFEPIIPDSRPSLKESDRVRIALVGVMVEGATGSTKPTDFFPLYSGLLGGDASLSDIYRIADAITGKLKAEGRPTAKATVPPQQISGGIVRIVIMPENGQ